MNYSSKKIKLIVFDLDGTLNISKSPMDVEMSNIMQKLLNYKDVAIISGGSYIQFQKQFLASLQAVPDRISHLYLFPTCATAMYINKKGKWKKIYGHGLSKKTRTQILSAFKKALPESGFKTPAKIYGELIEDRKTQITFSAFGQLAPIKVKSNWDLDRKKRKNIIKYLVKYLPKGYRAKMGGTSSIDVTKEGIDKAYGIRKISKELGFGIKEILFIGDALFKGGNDYPVKSTGVECISVKGPEDTKKILRKILAATT